MKHSFQDIPRDMLPEIVSYITYLPIYASLNRDIYRRSQYNYKLLVERVCREYTHYTIRNIEAIKFNLNKAAIHRDWDAFQTIAHRSKDNMDASEFAIVCARINGRADISAMIHKNSAQYNSLSYIDIYFKSFAWSDQFILNYLFADREYDKSLPKIDVRFGWVAPNVQRVATNLYHQIENALWLELGISGLSKYVLVPMLVGNLMAPITRVYAKYPYLTELELINHVDEDVSVDAIFESKLPLNIVNIYRYRKQYSDVRKRNLKVWENLDYLDKFDYTY